MKQTAVEWLQIELEKLWVQKYLSPITVKPLIEQAKEMEKEQMERIYYGYNQYNDEHLDFEQYYNETFKQE